MYRKTFDRIVATTGLLLAGLLLVAGSLLAWAHNFVTSEVSSQLTQQQITFPAKGNAQLNDPKIGPYLTKYAGQTLANGAQAKAYADHFIAVHLNGIGGGQTYAQLSTKAQANPTDTALAAQVQTMFRGETLRGMLLDAYAFWKMGQIAMIASWFSFIGAALVAGMSALGLRHAKRTEDPNPIFLGHEEIVRV
jgi:hypothetical protein